MSDELDDLTMSTDASTVGPIETHPAYTSYGAYATSDVPLALNVLYATFRPDDPLRAQLDRIEAKLDQILASTGTVRFLKVYDWDTGSIERIREGGSSYGFDGSVSAP